MKYMKGKYEQSRCFQSLLLLFLPIIAFVILSGCLSQQPEVLKVNHAIEYDPLKRYQDKSEGSKTSLLFYPVKGGI